MLDYIRAYKEAMFKDERQKRSSCLRQWSQQIKLQCDSAKLKVLVLLPKGGESDTEEWEIKCKVNKSEDLMKNYWARTPKEKRHGRQKKAKGEGNWTLHPQLGDLYWYGQKLHWCFQKVTVHRGALELMFGRLTWISVRGWASWS